MHHMLCQRLAGWLAGWLACLPAAPLPAVPVCVLPLQVVAPVVQALAPGPAGGPAACHFLAGIAGAQCHCQGGPAAGLKGQHGTADVAGATSSCGRLTASPASSKGPLLVFRCVYHPASAFILTHIFPDVVVLLPPSALPADSIVPITQHPSALCKPVCLQCMAITAEGEQASKVGSFVGVTAHQTLPASAAAAAPRAAAAFGSAGATWPPCCGTASTPAPGTHAHTLEWVVVCLGVTRACVSGKEEVF